MMLGKTRGILGVLLIMSFRICPACRGTDGGGKADKVMITSIANLKKTVIFLGRINPDGKPQIYATGVLVNVQNTYNLITAKHVVINPLTGQRQDENLLAFFNLKGGGVTVRSVAEIKKEFGVDWTYHPNAAVDVAIIPFPIDLRKDDVLVVSDELFFPAQNLNELDDIFFLSYQPGIDPKGKITPVIRGGIVSLLNDDRTFYIDATAFPGNTGSPVFLKPSAMTVGERLGSANTAPMGGRFVGIIGEYISYQELAVSAQTGRPRIVFEENTGLSRVWSAGFMREIINSDAFRLQLKRVAGR